MGYRILGFVTAMLLASIAHAERITVLGTGMMGSALGPRLAAAGHVITYGTRNPKAGYVAAVLERTGAGATALPHAEAVEDADIVIVAVPWRAVASLVEPLRDGLAGKTVIDITNAIENAEDGLPMLMVETSAAEMLQAQLPRSRVVKAFNTVGFHVVAEPERAPGGVTVPVAGDDAQAKAEAMALVEQLGFEAFDAGPLRFARTLERLAGLYRVPHWSGRRESSFEFYFRPVPEPTPMEFPVLLRPR